MSNSENMHTPEQPDENPYRARILYDAAQLITGDRQKDYGPPDENFARIAEHWTVHLKKKLQYDTVITARDVAELMILLKVARLAQSPTDDTYKDIGGYAGIGAEIADNEKTLAEQIQVMPDEENYLTVQGHISGTRIKYWPPYTDQVTISEPTEEKNEIKPKRAQQFWSSGGHE